MRLEFINQDASTPNLSDAARRTIQRVSRRAGAATRKARGGFVRNNRLQMPDFLLQETQSVTTLSLPVSDKHHPSSIPRPMPDSNQVRGITKGYAVLMQPDIAARLVHCAGATSTNSNPRRWVKLCGHSKWLDHAVECVILRVELCLMHDREALSRQNQIQQTYDRAIRGLSVAISSPTVDWTMWYAALLLALFELLDYASERSWVMHSRGAFNMLEALGPSNIKTETEKDMLVIQAELMILESTFANVGIYLDRPEWQEALRSTIISGRQYGDRSESAVSLWMITAIVPTLFQRATDVITNQSVRSSKAIVDSLRKVLLDYSIWNSKWGDGLFEDTAGHYGFPSGIPLNGVEIFAIYLAYFVLMNRFLSALEPQMRVTSEMASVSGSLRIFKLAELFETSSDLPLRVSLALRVATSIQHSTHQWSPPQFENSSGLPNSSDSRIFEDWCALLCRSTGEPKSCMELG